jgi:hypothetical protein
MKFFEYLNEVKSKDKVYLVGKTLWVGSRPCNGMTSNLKNLKTFVTDKKGEHYDDITKKLKNIIKNNTLIEIPIFIDCDEAFDEKNKIGQIYAIRVDQKDYTIISFFKTKQEAKYFLNDLSESISDEKIQYQVVQIGGSIGEKTIRDKRSLKGLPIEDEDPLFDDKNDAKEKAKRMNKMLSKGEKSFYGIKYIVAEVINKIYTGK